MADQYEFLSDAWVLALQQEAQILLDADKNAGDAEFTYIERFTDTPAPRSDGKEAGYIIVFSSGTVTVRSGVQESDQADSIVRMGYAEAFATMQVKSGPDLDEIGRKAYAAGALHVTGSPQGIPISMSALHDRICERTRVPVGSA